LIDVDLIIPSIISYQKYPQFQKFQKLQVFQKLALPAWTGNWFPVWYNLKNLENRGIKIKFLNYQNLKRNISKIVGFDSRIINNLILKYGSVKKTLINGIIPLLKKLNKRVDYLIYFDNADSTGQFHSEVLPYVDIYFKKQLLKDRSLYSENLYGKRLFTDFYAKNYNFEVKTSSTRGDEFISRFKDKIALSWNFALKDYRYSNLISRFLYGFTRKNNLKFYKPSKDRKLILSANFTIKPTYNLIYFQRNQLLQILKEKYGTKSNVSLGKIPKKNYLLTMRFSKAIVSPYGWGEICYRDFETFIAGAALIKPDMDHLDTWPNLYKKDETYISIPWKIEEWGEIFPEILADDKLLLQVARNGQKFYKNLLTKEGNKKFCEHFIEMITPKS